MLQIILAVAAGSAVGGTLRYVVALLLPTAVGRWPWPTLLVNLIGCFLLGLLSGWFSRYEPSPALRAFLTIGVCGGFTTFSSFINEDFQLFRSGQLLSAVAYPAVSFVLGLLLLILGYRLMEGLSFFCLRASDDMFSSSFYIPFIDFNFLLSPSPIIGSF